MNDDDSITTWDYRVMVSSVPTGGGDYADAYRIIEAYYGADGEQVLAWSDSVTPYGDALEQLRSDLELMLRSFDRPTLNEAELIEATRACDA